MIKIHILVRCEHCQGDAYLPIGQATSHSGETYTRYKPCPACQGSGNQEKWVSLQVFLMLSKKVAKATHVARIVNAGSPHTNPVSRLLRIYRFSRKVVGSSDQRSGKGEKTLIASRNLTAFPFWLGVMMDANQVKPEARERVARFKQGVADIAWKIFGPTFVSLDIIEKLGQVDEQVDQVDEAYPRDLLE